jgi:hypothetical protein
MRARVRDHQVLRAVLVALVVAALSALVIAPAPSYDPWAWLLWGREIAHGTLSTEEMPAFKPLTVAACTLLAPLGGWAPEAWVIVARAGGVLAVLLGFRLGREWAGVAGGLVAAAGVAFTGDLIGYSAAGAEPGWTIAFALLGFEAWRGGRPRAALACGVACALLRVEAWPFLLAFGFVLWPRHRALLIACAVAVPALWFIPEWIGSGDLLRSGARARVPNPGQPATESFPALAALLEADALPLWPLWAGTLFAPRAARPLLWAGLAWIALVAVMAQAGFSGEARYSLPGAALVSIVGAVGLVTFVRRRRRALAWLAAVLLLIAAAPKLADLPDLRDDQAYQRTLAADLAAVIDEVGRDAVLACGRPYVGDLRGPLLAYHLDVEKQRVAFEPRPPGVAFLSRIAEDAPVEPPTGPAFTPRTRLGRWEVRTAC